MPRWNRVGPDGLYGRRPGPRGRMRHWIRNWTDRHPFSTLAICLVVLGFITWWEAARIEGAQGTVTQGWGTGLAVGILACLGPAPPGGQRSWLPGPASAAAEDGHTPGPDPGGQPQRLRTRHAAAVRLTGGPYVITTGIEVGEITYVATFSAYFLVLVIWMAIRLYRRRCQ